MAKTDVLEGFRHLSWDDLDAWAGGKIVSRGRDYQRRGLVSELAVTEDGALLSRIDGTEAYAARVFIDESGSLDSHCTCPYPYQCKHAVATVLEYLDRIENDLPVPETDGTDERMFLGDDRGEIDDGPGPEHPAAQEGLSALETRYLQKKTKAQLVELMVSMAAAHPDVAEELADRARLESGNVKQLSSSLLREIRKVGEEDGWRNYWTGEGYTPDYSGIRNKLLALLENGHADEALFAGKALLEHGIRQVEESGDHGETGQEVALSLGIVCKALADSSLAPREKLLWAVDAVLMDDPGLCSAFEGYLAENHPRDAWRPVADDLLRRLEKSASASGEDGFHSRYERDRLSNMAIQALQRSGRSDEIIPLCEAEAFRTRSYERLVRRLLDAGRFDEAVRWIAEGIEATKDSEPYEASRLRSHLYHVLAIREDWPSIAAMRAEDFAASPSVDTFDECRNSMVRIKTWDAARACLFAYLETGVAPWRQETWPLEKQDMDESGERVRRGYPDHSALIELHLHESNPERALHWYDKLPKSRRRAFGSLDDCVAQAVKMHAPDRAVGIWKAMAEDLIAVVNPKAYRQAATYLRNASKLMAGEKRRGEWDRYIDELRRVHARKRRLMEVLDTLDGKPILQGGSRRG